LPAEVNPQFSTTFFIYFLSTVFLPLFILFLFSFNCLFIFFLTTFHYLFILFPLLFSLTLSSFSNFPLFFYHFSFNIFVTSTCLFSFPTNHAIQMRVPSLSATKAVTMQSLPGPDPSRDIDDTSRPRAVTRKY